MNNVVLTAIKLPVKKNLKLLPSMIQILWKTFKMELQNRIALLDISLDHEEALKEI